MRNVPAAYGRPIEAITQFCANTESLNIDVRWLAFAFGSVLATILGDYPLRRAIAGYATTVVTGTAVRAFETDILRLDIVVLSGICACHTCAVRSVEHKVLYTDADNCERPVVYIDFPVLSAAVAPVIRTGRTVGRAAAALNW